MVAVRVEALTKVFEPGVVALDDVTLEVASGEFLVLLGEGGSGKTTLLRLLGGLETPTTGSIEVGGVPLADLPDREAVIAVVFQSYSVYQHLTVAQNIGFPLRGAHSDVGERVAEAARHLGIADLLGRLPAHLSRGQRQRVAMARAIVRRPAILLLDEPLSNVDPRIWAELRGDIVALTKRLGITTIYVTHDRDEAVDMADRIVVLDHGKLVWKGFSPFTGLDTYG
ncbi:ATP-binding cassette domain-containing protein [Actinoplanes sp. NBRC 103695]|uniref:ABC transporter ATP-binding protein n=1 Tax=Actinoplanes sp. NBRC 103695 TaxID=3032202 RepID=UPI00255253E2|nr:ATP-binding cassette domain-containing protein [Actinoplanes sp. NBRC 103695]